MVLSEDVYRNDSVEPTPDDFEQIFSAPCLTCDTIEHDLSVLCSHCRHLRLHHLFVCLEQTLPTRVPLINMGSLEDLYQRQSCHFCKMIVELFRLPQDVLEMDEDDRSAAIVLLGGLRDPRKHNSESSQGLKPPQLIQVDLARELSSNMAYLDSRHVKVFSPGTWAASPSLDIRAPSDTSRIASAKADLSKARSWLYQKPAIIRKRHSGLSKDLRMLKIRIKQKFSAYLHRPSRESSMGIHDLPPDFTLIDVRRKCIVRAPKNPKFAALSYVWGECQRPTVETRKSNLKALRKPGSLAPDSLPKTISDAMTVCQELDTPYLWVDRLCIVQDESTQKHDQIGAMDAIYSSAFFTICEAAGTNSDHGLSGVSTTTKQFFWPYLQLGRLRLLPLLPNINWSIARSVWNSRGWTYQEAILSERLLVFTPWQMFFRYGGTVLSEDSLAVNAPWSTLETLPPGRTYKEGSSYLVFQQYARCVFLYSRRELKYTSDVYNAFAGIFKRLYSDLAANICGLPESAFDYAILWRGSFGAAGERVDHDGLRIPSWAWPSWDGEVDYLHNVMLSTIGSVARWAIKDEKGHLRILSSTSDVSGHWNTDASLSSHLEPKPLLRRIDGYDQRASTDPRQYMLAAWRSCIETPMPRELSVENRQELCQRWRTYEDFWKEAHGSHRFPTLGSDTRLPLTKLLLVRTSVAELNLVRFPANLRRSELDCDFFILDSKGVRIGLFYIPPDFCDLQLGTTAPGAYAGSFTFLALSIAYSSEQSSWLIDKHGDIFSSTERSGSSLVLSKYSD